MINYKEDILQLARRLVQNQLGNDSSGHDFEHVARVVFNAKKLANHFFLTEEDLFVVELAAWLHDIDDRKIEKQAADMSVDEFLQNNKIDLQMINQIKTIIDNMSFHSQMKGAQMNTLLGQIVQDADRLDALGVIGVARSFAYGGTKKRPLSETIKHFEDKLFKLLPLFNLECAKEIAYQRHQETLQFYERYQAENLYERGV
ncbi:MAG: HD domain-containing protein [Bacilli bacterium]|jgi:uncharacterized protein|nr:HD domain-containing protein [Bacilli bacterium]MDD3389529.1 HD domain-containing protein [Bacilli bacterium]MDD4344816.1 HD domain-containing protein [Bacilli bacterium]MDD4520798.1 HD domain-containing protein [Bacilli bacterium]MDY0399428.1 HD domain-containing protein [Bacilli bacterium]